MSSALNLSFGLLQSITGLVTALVKKHREMKATLEDVTARLHRLEAISLLLNDLQANPALTAVTTDFLEALRRLQSLLEDAHKQSKSERTWSLFKATYFTKDQLAEWNQKLDSLSNDLQLALVVVIASNNMRKETPKYEIQDEDDTLEKPKQGKLIGVDVTEPEKPIITDFQSALPGAVSTPVTSPPTSPVPKRKSAKGTDSPSSSSGSGPESPAISHSLNTKEVSATRSHGQAGANAPPRSSLPPIDQEIVTNLIVTHRLRAIEQVRRGYLKIEERFVGGVFIQCRRLDPFWFRLYFVPNAALNIRYLVFRSFKMEDVTKKFDEYVTPQQVRNDEEAIRNSGSPTTSPAASPVQTHAHPTADDKEKDKKKDKKDKKDIDDKKKRNSKEKEKEKEKEKKDSSKDKKK